jgi:hypothetical protein
MIQRLAAGFRQTRLRERGGVNLYQYVLGNPVNAADPLGLWQFTITGGYIGGGQLTFGNNGGSGLFNGQWNWGLKVGAAIGLSIGLDGSDSGCRKKGPSFGANASATLGNFALGGGTSYDYDSKSEIGTLSYGGRLGPFSSSRIWTLDDHGRLVDPRESASLSNFGASAFAGFGLNYAGKKPSSGFCLP